MRKSARAECGEAETTRPRACVVCGNMPFRQHDPVLPAMAHQELHAHGARDASDSLHRSNHRKESGPRLPTEAARNTADRCLRHSRKLQKDLVKLGLLNQDGQKVTGTSENCCTRVIAPFSYKEVRTGKLLGTGGFSAVFEVTTIVPDAEPESAQERAARMHIKNSALAEVSSPLGKLGKSKNQSEKKQGNEGQATSRSKESQYAIKHLRAGLTKEPEKFERAAIDLVLEAQLLLAMDHPHIISLRGWSGEGVQGYANGRNTDFFIIMDRLSESLDQRILEWRNESRKSKSRSKLPWGKQKQSDKLEALVEERLVTMYQIATAVEYMHDRRIINRDLKTSNVGFDMKGQLKVFDFGLSRLLPKRRSAMEDGYTMSRVGTKYYMAPEVRAKAPYNLSADVYSFGVVFWEVMSLSSTRETLQKVKKDEVVPSRRCMLPLCPCWSSYVRKFIESSLSNDPHLRPRISDIRAKLGIETKQMDGLCSKPLPGAIELDLSTMSTSKTSRASNSYKTSLASSDVDSMHSSFQSSMQSSAQANIVHFGQSLEQISPQDQATA